MHTHVWQSEMLLLHNPPKVTHCLPSFLHSEERGKSFLKWKFQVQKSDTGLCSTVYLWMPSQQWKCLEIPAETQTVAPCRAPSLCPEVRLVFDALGFTSLLLKVFRKKNPLHPDCKIAVHFHPESFDGTTVGCQIQHLSLSLLFSRTFRFPSLSLAWPPVEWIEGCSCQLSPPHPLVKLQLGPAVFSL